MLRHAPKMSRQTVAVKSRAPKTKGLCLGSPPTFRGAAEITHAQTALRVDPDRDAPSRWANKKGAVFPQRLSTKIVTGKKRASKSFVTRSGGKAARQSSAALAQGQILAQRGFSASGQKRCGP